MSELSLPANYWVEKEFSDYIFDEREIFDINIRGNGKVNKMNSSSFFTDINNKQSRLQKRKPKLSYKQINIRSNQSFLKKIQLIFKSSVQFVTRLENI